MRSGLIFFILSCAITCSLASNPAASAAEVDHWVVLPGEFGVPHGLRWGMLAAEATEHFR